MERHKTEKIQKRRSRIDTGTVRNKKRLANGIYPKEIEHYKDRLQPGMLVWIPTVDEDGNISGHYATVKKKYPYTVLLTYESGIRYQIGTGYRKTELRLCPSYISLMFLERGRYEKKQV